MNFLVFLYKEIVQFFRNKGLLFFALYAFTLDIYLAATGINLSLRNAKFYVQDYDLSYYSRELVSKFPSTVFKLQGYLFSDKDLERVLLSDKALGVIRISQNFEKRIKRGEKTEVGIVVNGSEVAASYLFFAYATQIISKFLFGIFPVQLPLEVKTRVFFNQDSSSRLFMAYSELLTVITLFLILLPASAVVLEKERGNIEMLTVSPVSNYVFMVSKTVSMGILILTFTFLALYFTIGLWVKVPFKGSILDFMLLTAIYVFTSSGLSMFIASLSSNMLQVSQLTVLVLIPILYLSGDWTPIEAMPKVLQYLSVLSPLKYYIDGALSIAIKGMSLTELYRDALLLTVQGLVLFILGNFFMLKKL